MPKRQRTDEITVKIRWDDEAHMHLGVAKWGDEIAREHGATIGEAAENALYALTELIPTLETEHDPE